MFKLLFLLLLAGSALFANMGAIIIIPTDSAFIMGVYSGSSSVSTEIQTDSTNTVLDGRKTTIDTTDAFLGGYLGVQNSYYRFSLSYDLTDSSELELARLLFNFDFKIADKGKYRPILGFGIGATTSEYTLDNRNISQDKGVIVFRAGTEYSINRQNSLEVLVEYSHMLDSGGSQSYLDRTDFTSYKVDSQDGIMLRIGYNFEF